MVFVDGDDLNGFVLDLVCGILDGYIVLKCEFVMFSYYFVILVLDLVSRIMEEIVLLYYW